MRPTRKALESYIIDCSNGAPSGNQLGRPGPMPRSYNSCNGHGKRRESIAPAAPRIAARIVDLAARSTSSPQELHDFPSMNVSMSRFQSSQWVSALLRPRYKVCCLSWQSNRSSRNPRAEWHRRGVTEVLVPGVGSKSMSARTGTPASESRACDLDLDSIVMG